ncbi:MAG: hypothetical protein IT422_13750 [Pirellulaceae bacterium]|nr:hypothetical protein [Pirellulaceae bacterium]
MTKQELQDARIRAIIGDGRDPDFGECRDKFYDHLVKSMQIPCDVTGIEDFDWEEFYVFGPGDPKEYARLRKNRPSYTDIFELLAIEKDVVSQWKMFAGEDLAGHVRRKTDGKEFHLGLAEIKVVDKKSPNNQLLDDYAVWLVNNR